MLNVLLIGQPNSGKSTLFNKLTGNRSKTGNYPGVTVDYHYGTVTDSNIHLVDTPGINSLFPSSLDEQLTVESLVNHPEFGRIHRICCVVDATQIGRQLYIPMLLKSHGYDVTVALTMIDILDRRALQLNIETLRRESGLKVIPVDYREDTSLDSLISQLTADVQESHPEFPIPERDQAQVIDDFKRNDAIANAALTDVESDKISPTERIDKWVLNPYLAVIIFIAIMGTVFTSIFWMATPVMDFIDSVFSSAADGVRAVLPESIFRDFLADGIIGGVGAVVVFLPQIAILFFWLGLLEDSGYLARAAVIIDKPLQKIGLSGRSFVPMLSGFACAIPALMSARTIKDRNERWISMFIIPLMSCSARLPVYTILLTLITPKDQPWVGGIGLFLIYAASVLFSSVIAWVISRFRKMDFNAPFALELPAYRLPYLPSILRQVWGKARAYLVDAGTVILIISAIMWTLSTFPQCDDTGVDGSYLGQAGKVIEPAMTPLGQDWRTGVAVISSFAAREVFVSSMIQVYRVSDSDDFEDETIRNGLIQTLSESTHVQTGNPLFTTASIYALIVFYIFALMCFPTVSVAKQEFGSWKIAIIQFSVLTLIGYIGAVLTYQLFTSIGV